MKRMFKIINVIAAIVFFVFAMAVDTSDLAIKLCLITGGYLFLYMYGKEIVIAVVNFIASAMKEDK